VLLVATALGIYLCFELAQPFLPPLAWALALAILFLPFHRWLEARLKHPDLAATVSVLLLGLIVVAPMAFVGQRLVTEAVKGVDTLRERIESGAWERTLEAQPRLAPLVRGIARRFDLSGSVDTLATSLTNTAASFLRSSVVQVVQIVLVFYFTFYFLRDRRSALQSLRALSPLSPAEMDHLFRRVADTVYATVYGTLAVASVQGLLGGLMFWWLGLPTPLLWGVVMGLLAVVPVLGAFVVWIPAALFLALEGSWGKALLLTVWGGAVVGGIDNLLYPILVGSRLKLHTVLAFLAMVGGLVVFGASGLILGPVALTITQALLGVWRNRAAEGTPAADGG
jgi:predicted PurR-regulated permease PerM